MILTAFHGFCMALADSVPGVSGGTIAFILGFYERFLDALHNVVRGSRAARKDACTYLLKLGVGLGHRHGQLRGAAGVGRFENDDET